MADIGIDLGTTSVSIYASKKGLILKEPCVVAFDRAAREIKAIGEEAVELMEANQGNNMVLIRPIREGEIVDLTITQLMVKYFIQKGIGQRSFLKPRITVCMPISLGEAQRKGIEEIIYQSGAREVRMIDEPMAAAIGAGIDMNKAEGTMIVDIGGGTTDMSILSMGGVVKHHSVRIGGNDFDLEMMDYLKRERNIIITARQVEDLKVKIGQVMSRPEVVKEQVVGIHALTGTPLSITVNSREMQEASRHCVEEILEGIHYLLRSLPPSLAGDIATRGILFIGGSSLLYGWPELVLERIGIQGMVVPNPELVIAKGTGEYIKEFKKK